MWREGQPSEDRVPTVNETKGVIKIHQKCKNMYFNMSCNTYENTSYTKFFHRRGRSRRMGCVGPLSSVEGLSGVVRWDEETRR